MRSAAGAWPQPAAAGASTDPPVAPPAPRPHTSVHRLTLRVWDTTLSVERLQGIGYLWECRTCGGRGKLRDEYSEAAREARHHKCDPWGDGR